MIFGFRKSENAEAEQRLGHEPADPWQNQKARVLVFSFFVVFDHPKLQIQEGDTGGQEGPIQYARAHMEAHELQVTYRVGMARHGLPQLCRLLPERRRQVQAASASVCQEARRHALGNERHAVSESEGRVVGREEAEEDGDYE